MRPQAMPPPDALHRTDTDAALLGHCGSPVCGLAWRIGQCASDDALLNCASQGGMRDGRILSRSRPLTPSVMNRSCHRQTAVLLVPVRRMISAVPQPSAVSSTMCARQTCFWGAFRSATMAASRLRSVALTSTMTPVRMP